MVRFAPELVAAIHIDKFLGADYTYPIIQSRFCCQDYNFTPGEYFQANSAQFPGSHGAGFFSSRDQSDSSH